MTTTNTRANDARLHELLFGVTCEMRAGHYDHECGDFIEYQSNYRDNPHSMELLQRALADGDYELQPCTRINADNWQVVPDYRFDANAIRTAEAALPVELREDYAWQIAWNMGMVGIHMNNLFALITATPAQRAAALVSVLERVKAKEVAG